MNAKQANPKPRNCQYDITALPADLESVDTSGCKSRADFAALPAGTRWSNRGFQQPPAIGSRVAVSINELGCGKVESYFIEHGWLGLMVKLDCPPEWHRLQTAKTPYPGRVMVFGAEVARICTRCRKAPARCSYATCTACDDGGAAAESATGTQ